MPKIAMKIDVGQDEQVGDPMPPPTGPQAREPGALESTATRQEQSGVANGRSSADGDEEGDLMWAAFLEITRLGR